MLRLRIWWFLLYAKTLVQLLWRVKGRMFIKKILVRITFLRSSTITAAILFMTQTQDQWVSGINLTSYHHKLRFRTILVTHEIKKTGKKKLSKNLQQILIPVLFRWSNHDLEDWVKTDRACSFIVDYYEVMMIVVEFVWWTWKEEILEWTPTLSNSTKSPLGFIFHGHIIWLDLYSVFLNLIPNYCSLGRW